MYACMYGYIYTHIFMYICTYVDVYIYTYNIYIYIYIYICICICTYIYTQPSNIFLQYDTHTFKAQVGCIYVHLRMCVYTHIHTCMVYVYNIHIGTHARAVHTDVYAYP